LLGRGRAFAERAGGVEALYQIENKKGTVPLDHHVMAAFMLHLRIDEQDIAGHRPYRPQGLA
jgi:hypothetical protein